MTNNLAVIVFDVNETLSDMSPLADRFVDVGAPGLMAGVWFAGLLRDGFALTVVGANEKFATIAAELLHENLTGLPLNRSVDEAVEYILRGFASLALHPDVAGAVRTFAASGMRLVTLSNGSTQLAETLFRDANIREEFEMLLSVEDAPGWKPLRAAYEYAADACGVEVGRMLLTAVHPWDIHGAALAGLRTAWINRAGATYPGYFTAPDITVSTLDELASILGNGA
ncbi:haloacid dehalogenase type II [Glaciihabitans sp. GrIS 2.15]|uniref:haloacid dehalogenase type II n=1 Tax=Glaciihabitans sp. GrIS 2.15 TaxID=3071710 RepID=UPI002DFECBF4|nr:2-haloacid dehalogenase [Glaciihabitans sp. GrIS 2.15]